MTTEVTDCRATDVDDDDRGPVSVIGWALSVADSAGTSLTVHVAREGRGYAVVGWNYGADDWRDALRPADTLDDDVAMVVDEYMHRGRR